MRALMIALVVLAAAPAVASERFPAEGDAWHYEGRTPVAGGVARFLRLEATPAPRSGWTVTMTCGTVRVVDGREVVTYRGTGPGGRSRWGSMGGTSTAPGHDTTGWLIEQTGDGLLDQAVQAQDSVCASGRGDLSAGD
ncbi:hypothetical protein MKK58_17665 [Methylobacterium sp. J-078]|uniref:hypothetical protein n=1 Tax=Methylobacterium sp. J-078 TaxID=2836657 RepID=UPI001FB90AF8|nr:hypothetical protein [Methylobacterium sp. J-078]MCJ2046346.1 hypothetical protein [Methylobacterium sp. J-078]